VSRPRVGASWPSPAGAAVSVQPADYVLGLTRIPLAQYALASVLFMLPGAIVYTYLGYAGREPGRQRGLLQKASSRCRCSGRWRSCRGSSHACGRGRHSAWRSSGAASTPERTCWCSTCARKRTSSASRATSPAPPISPRALEARLDELAPELERPIALLCRTDRRSAKAAALLARRGFATCTSCRRA